MIVRFIRLVRFSAVGALVRVRASEYAARRRRRETAFDILTKFSQTSTNRAALFDFIF
jgi:hypothetical protein